MPMNGEGMMVSFFDRINRVGGIEWFVNPDSEYALRGIITQLEG